MCCGELRGHSGVCGRRFAVALNLNLVYDVVDARQLSGQILGFFSFLRGPDGAFEGEGSVECRVLDVATLQRPVRCECRLVAIFDGAVELRRMAGSILVALEPGIVDLNLIDDGVARGGLPGELLGSLPAVGGADNASEGNDAGPPVLGDGYAAEVMLFERVVDGGSMVGMIVVTAGGEGKGCCESSRGREKHGRAWTRAHHEL